MAKYNKQLQVKEIIKCGKDPKYFFKNYLKIQHPVKGLIPFKTFKFQDDCVESFVDNRFNIVLKSRQLGMSTLAAAYAVKLGYSRQQFVRLALQDELNKAGLKFEVEIKRAA